MGLPVDYPELTDYAVSDQAAAYIADALMELALKFEANHYSQIRRHLESLKPDFDDRQLDLFKGQPPFSDSDPKNWNSIEEDI